MIMAGTAFNIVSRERLQRAGATLLTSQTAANAGMTSPSRISHKTPGLGFEDPASLMAPCSSAVTIKR